MLFFVTILVTAFSLVPFCCWAYEFRQKAVAEAPPGYNFPKVADFALTAKATFVFCICDYVCREHLFVFFRPYCKEQTDSVLRDIRCKKSAVHLYKFLYFMATTTYGYHIMKDTHFLSKLYGGSADSFAAGQLGHPYQDRSSYPRVREYQLITFGYHCQGVVSLLVTAHKCDFIEMGLHHGICLILYIGCYLLNICELSAEFGWMHDLADVPLALTKVLAETRFSTATGSLFFFTTLLWTYTRCMAMPVITWQCLFDTPNPGWHALLVPFFCFYMCCLVMLHFYWLSMFIKMLNKYI